MNDNKLVFSLVIGVIVLFGLFMALSGDDSERVDVMVTEEPEPVQLPAPVPEPPSPETTVPPPAPEVVEEPEALPPETEPEVVEEVAEVEEAPVPAPEPLPNLNNSDDFVLAELMETDGGSAIMMHLVSEQLIRKFVVMVENMSRGEFPDRNLPLERPMEPMQVTELGSEFYLMDEASYRRFDNLVNAFTNVSTETAVRLYDDFTPLFREAYAELGIPSSNFHTVMLTAIDNVLNARSAPQPQQLVRPSLAYEYADPEIENYSDVEKLLMRLGPRNTENLQQRLEFFKRRLELQSR
tara:strand:- start:103708 stop:104595 length:888 start_codon:yes stop_codon:yes gene_type:complete